MAKEVLYKVTTVFFKKNNLAPNIFSTLCMACVKITILLSSRFFSFTNYGLFGRASPIIEALFSKLDYLANLLKGKKVLLKKKTEAILKKQKKVTYHQKHIFKTLLTKNSFRISFLKNLAKH